MIRSSNLKSYRRRLQQQQQERLIAPIHDDWMNPHGIRPPPGSGFRRRPQLIQEPRPAEEAEDEEEDEEEDGEEEDYYTSYGGADEEERDQRISGWAGSVAGAAAGNPDFGVESDYASLRASSDDEADATQEEEVEEVGPREPDGDEEVFPSIETQDTPASVTADTRASLPAQLPSQTLRRSARLRQNTRVLIARLLETGFDPVARLSKRDAGVLDLSNKGSRPNDQEALLKSLDRVGPKKQSLALEFNESPMETSETSRNSAIDAYLGAMKQNAAIKYFDRDHPAKREQSFLSSRSDSSTSSLNNASEAQTISNSDYFPVCTLNHSGSSEPDEISSCAIPACAWHRAAAYMIKYARPRPGNSWPYYPGPAYGYAPPLASASEAENHEDRDRFPLEQHRLDYGSEIHEDRDCFPAEMCLLDSDGDAQPKEEPAPEAGNSAKESDESDDNEEVGSGSDGFAPADENNACNGGSDDEVPNDDEEQEIKSESSDSSSDGSEDDFESEESVKGSEDEDVSEDESVAEDQDVEENEDVREDESDYASLERTIAPPRTPTTRPATPPPSLSTRIRKD